VSIRFQEFFLSAKRSTVFLAATLALLLQACTNTPATSSAGAAAGADTAPEPELTLNLPKPEDCSCTPEKPVDYTFLDKGYSALLNGEYVEAVQHFQRYQRLESSTRADWEARISIAYVSMLPRSPFYDPEAARKTFRELKEQKPKEFNAHDYTRLMRQSVLNFLILEQRIEDLERSNTILKTDLEKREEALKRLRELTLGQKGVAQ
jgi:tetratricopeptide (TPR) repeat protein